MKKKIPGALLTLVLALLLSSAPAFPQSAVPDTIAQRSAACEACHGRQGRGAGTGDGYAPRIAGKPAGYLYNQLVNFREGRRQYQPMTYMVSYLSDAYLMEIARYFSEIHLPYPVRPSVSASPLQLDRGRELVMHGDAALKVPACIACHGKNLTGYGSAIPALVGLPHDYLNAQFGNWKNRSRYAAEPDCMAAIVSHLNPGDISAVSIWLAAQRVPADSAPAAALPEPLPIQCGSVPQ